MGTICIVGIDCLYELCCVGTKKWNLEINILLWNIGNWKFRLEVNFYEIINVGKQCCGKKLKLANLMRS